MANDFEFRAQSDLLASLRRDVEALKRQAAAGVGFTIEVPVLGQSGGQEGFDGPTSGGLRTDVYRHNEFVNLSGNGVVTTTGALGNWLIRTPFTAYVSSGVNGMVGRWRGYDTSASAEASGNCLIGHGSTDLLMVPDSGGLVQPTVPWTWATGDFLYFDVRMRLMPGT